MARIFLSHAAPDRVKVRQVAEALKRAGHEAWLAEDEARVGESIPAAIRRGLASTDFVVACLSRSAIESGWVAGELDLFVLRAFADRMGRILPMRLDAVEPPALVRHLGFADLFPEPFEQGLSELLRTIDERAKAIREGSEEIGPALPPNNLPPRRLFVARGEDLEAIRKALSSPGGRASIVGPAETGKTWLAVEYAFHAAGRVYPGGIWWLPAEEAPVEALAGLAETLRAAALPGVRDMLAELPADASAEVVARSAARALQEQRQPSLLILDDVRSQGWGELLPEGAVRVLATTRSDELAIGEPIHVGTPPTEAMVDLAWERWSPESVARRLLLGVAVFAPEAVPIEWAEAAAGLVGESHAAEAKEARAALIGTRLVVADEDRRLVAARPLVRGRVRERAEHEDSDRWIETNRRAAAAVAAWFEEARDPARMAEVDELRPHIDEAMRAAELGGDEREWLTIAGALSEHLGRRARYDEARALLEQVVRRADRLNPPEPRLVVVALMDLAQVLVGSGAKAEALPVIRRALAATEDALGKDHPNVATVLVAMGVMLLDLGDMTGAASSLERALSIYEKTSTLEISWISTTLSTLARTYTNLGQDTKIQPLFERAIAICEKVYGAEHPILSDLLRPLAIASVTSGRSMDARPLIERLLTIDEKTLGSSHPRVADDLFLLGAAFVEANEFIGARQVLERALDIQEKTLGPEHPSFAESLSGLAMVLFLSGQAAEARPLLERAISISERSGDEPTIAKHSSRLGSALSALGLEDEALRLFEGALAIYERLGDTSGVLRTLSGLAPVLEHSQRLAEALLVCERALALAETLYGADHPDLVKHLSSLANQLKKLGRPADARPLLERALIIAEKAHDPAHADVARVLADLAPVLRDLGKPTEARSHLERALPIFEQAEDHPRAAAASYRLAEIHGREGGWESARRFAERGLKHAKRADQAPLIAEGYRLLGDAALHGSDYENAQLFYEEAIRRYDALDRLREAADARLLLVTLLLQLGRTCSVDHVEWLREYIARPELSPEARGEVEAVLRLAGAAKTAT